MTKAMATATKRAMATNSNTMGNSYHCPLSSAAAAVRKDDKGGGSLFLYGVVVKKGGLCIFSILMFRKEAVCPATFLFPPYPECWVSILTVLI
jgi:hypothetical protein